MIGRLFIFFIFICIFARSFSKFDRPLCITYYTKPSQQSSLYMQNNLKCINFCSWQNTLRKRIILYHLNLCTLFTHEAFVLQSCVFIFNQTVSLFAFQLSLYISSHLIYQQCIWLIKFLVFFKHYPNLCVVSYTQSIFYMQKNAEWGIILIRRMHVLYHIVFN